MVSIRSPLGAMGALMVLLQSIAAAALLPLFSQPELQRILVWMMVAVTGALTLVVTIMVLYFTFWKPELLFSARDINPAIHHDLYGPSSGRRDLRTIPREFVTFEVTGDVPGNESEP